MENAVFIKLFGLINHMCEENELSDKFRITAVQALVNEYVADRAMLAFADQMDDMIGGLPGEEGEEEEDDEEDDDDTPEK